MKELSTASAVMDALGGTKAVHELTGCRHLSAASNWRAAGRFPSNTYVVMNEALAKIGYRAPRSLWGMVEATENTEPQRAAS